MTPVTPKSGSRLERAREGSQGLGLVAVDFDESQNEAVRLAERLQGSGGRRQDLVLVTVAVLTSINRSVPVPGTRDSTS